MPSAQLLQTAADATERDPREFPYGYLTGGAVLLVSVRAFLWFRTIDEMIETLLEVEPRVYNVKPGHGLEEYQARVRPILAQVRRQGFKESLRTEFAPDADGKFVVDWWGTYSDLRAGRGALGCQLLDEFLGGSRRGPCLPAEEEDEFIEFLKTCRA